MIDTGAHPRAESAAKEFVGFAGRVSGQGEAGDASGLVLAATDRQRAGRKALYYDYA